MMRASRTARMLLLIGPISLSQAQVVSQLGRSWQFEDILSSPQLMARFQPIIVLEGLRRIGCDNSWRGKKPMQQGRTASWHGKPPWPQHLQAT
jgi:hypothetical protein